MRSPAVPADWQGDLAMHAPITHAALATMTAGALTALGLLAGANAAGANAAGANAAGASTARPEIDTVTAISTATNTAGKPVRTGNAPLPSPSPRARAQCIMRQWAGCWTHGHMTRRR